jgi:hypothetical protein
MDGLLLDKLSKVSVCTDATELVIEQKKRKKERKKNHPKRNHKFFYFKQN